MDDATILNEIHKGIKMGMDSLENIYKKSNDPIFKDELSMQYSNFQTSLNTVSNALSLEGEIPDDTPINQKVMGWTGIQINTITDTSNSKLSEVLIQGYDMGIIKGTKLLNNSPEASTNTKNILNDFIKDQQHNINQLKKYL